MAWGPDPVQGLRGAVFDNYQRLFPRARTSAPVMIVEIDERALAAHGQWPWPRTLMAALVDRIGAAGSAAIGIDLLFPEPDRYSPSRLAAALPVLPQDVAEKFRALPTTDQVFAQSINANNVVMGIAGLPAVDPRYAKPPEVAPMRIDTRAPLALTRFAGHLQSLAELDRVAAGRGVLSNDSRDGVIRRAPLLVQIGDVTALALSLELLRVAAGGSVEVSDRPGGGLSVQLAELDIPMQNDGMMWIRYGRHDPARFVSAADVLAGKIPADLFKDRLVLVGITGLGLLDYRVTALGESVPGVEIHAQVIEQLFDGDDLSRPGGVLLAEIVLLLGAGTALVAFAPRRRVQRVLGSYVVAVALLAGAGILAFAQFGLLVDIASPALAGAAAMLLVLSGSLSEADRQRRELREHAAHMAGELAAAQRIQMGLLADPSEVFAGETRVRLAALLMPARDVGGDFYDCFRLDNVRVFLAVADVSGKGLAAALFMASAKSQLKGAVLANPADLPGSLRTLQRAIARENPESLFVTLYAAILDLDSGRLESVNAGHDAPWLLRAGKPPTQLEPAGGPPLCTLEEFDYPRSEFQLQPGDALLISTDGVSEAENREGAFFGNGRLAGCLRDHAANEPEALVDAVRAAVQEFAAGREASDDVTLMALRWTPPPGGGTAS
ncbi:MAG TPA: CHASE2 domain-containing protein [Usitatibacteraceae bacterium]|nr:CHASE2 domain-containing protein [Usitatibacteraceae bacterium]